MDKRWVGVAFCAAAMDELASAMQRMVRCITRPVIRDAKIFRRTFESTYRIRK
jgi:hypothetical protein